ncbi:MAG: hypothetical protein PWP27_1991 [Clostridiales bacterium]|nr:hypothetical protein [Clostridiales bacterium]
MNEKIAQRIDRHRRFLKYEETDRPIIGFYIGGWESLSRYSDNSESLFPKGLISYDDLTTDKFYEMYKNYAENLLYDDDFVRTLDPVPSIPWIEAACGCPINFTGKNFWSQKIGFEKTQESLDNMPISDNPWIKKYGEFVKFLASEFPDYAIGQSILRGPLDVMCALVGDSETIYNLYDEPEFIKKGLRIFSDVFNEFIRIQNMYTPKYHDGYGIGQFYMWTPGTVCRIQEDSMALITPGHYDEYVYEADVKITSETEYSLYHVHATGMFIMDKIVRNKNLSIVQVSKDEGNTKLSDLIDGMETIQNAGISVLIKGRFDKDDIDLMRKRLDKRALALGCVVDSIKEADELKEYLLNLNW